MAEFWQVVGVLLWIFLPFLKPLAIILLLVLVLNGLHWAWEQFRP